MGSSGPVQIQGQRRPTADFRGLRRQRQIEAQRGCLVGRPVRTGQPSGQGGPGRPARTRNSFSGHGQICGSRHCIPGHGQIRGPRDYIPGHGQIRGPRHCIPGHGQIRGSRHCIPGHGQICGSRDRFPRCGQIVSRLGGGRPNLENRAAEEANVIRSSSWNLAADFLTFCAFWADDFERGQAKPPIGYCIICGSRPRHRRTPPSNIVWLAGSGVTSSPAFRHGLAENGRPQSAPQSRHKGRQTAELERTQLGHLSGIRPWSTKTARPPHSIARALSARYCRSFCYLVDAKRRYRWGGRVAADPPFGSP